MSIAKQFNHVFSKGDFKLFDQNGNEVYYENSKGYWIKRKYDQDGNHVYWENSSGYWVKQEFNEEGIRVWFENSNGFWARWEFDGGNLIRYENSDEVVQN